MKNKDIFKISCNGEITLKGNKIIKQLILIIILLIFNLKLYGQTEVKIGINSSIGYAAPAENFQGFLGGGGANIFYNNTYFGIDYLFNKTEFIDISNVDFKLGFKLGNSYFLIGTSYVKGRIEYFEHGRNRGCLIRPEEKVYTGNLRGVLIGYMYKYKYLFFTINFNLTTHILSSNIGYTFN